jgi:Response regulator containing CheY-like receiver, AAA-type ATPase, and DNA-binding domains
VTAVKGKVLIIDDEPDMLETCSDILQAQGYAVKICRESDKALDIIFASDFDVIVIDMMMPKMGGLDLLREIRKNNPDISVIIFTGYPTIESAVNAIREGATDYLVKPFMANQFIGLLEKTFSLRRLKEENRLLRTKISGVPIDHGFIGVSGSIKEVLGIIQKVAPVESSVLITGESGTGKELVARTIHRNSKRSDQPFVPINCSALPESLLESEFFGYERGAFTGALSRTIGLFEFANKGTLFLDEIAELPLTMQAKILRVLQEKEIRRIGGKEQILVDVRIIAATNRNLEKMVDVNRFRQDLFYRLNVIRINVPPLRQRPDDIPVLARWFLEKFNKTHGRSIVLSDTTIDILMDYFWPGNVRELENAICHAASMADADTINPEDLPESVGRKVEHEPMDLGFSKSFIKAKDEVVRKFEKQFTLAQLEMNRGNVSTAAQKAGMHRSSFQRLIRKYHLDPARIKDSLIVDPAKAGRIFSDGSISDNAG